MLRHIADHPEEWDVDLGRTAVFGESAGGLMAALVALRARDAGPRLRAQVLVNPALDLTDAAHGYDSAVEHADCPTLTAEQMRLFQRLAAPTGARDLSPLHADHLGGLPPALVVVPTIDPVADHGRRYAARLRASGVPADLTEHPGATHAFLSMPGVVPQAKAARAEITAFLREHLGTPESAPDRSRRAGAWSRR